MAYFTTVQCCCFTGPGLTWSSFVGGPEPRQTGGPQSQLAHSIDIISETKYRKYSGLIWCKIWWPRACDDDWLSDPWQSGDWFGNVRLGHYFRYNVRIIMAMITMEIIIRAQTPDTLTHTITPQELLVVVVWCASDLWLIQYPLGSLELLLALRVGCSLHVCLTTQILLYSWHWLLTRIKPK